MARYINNFKKTVWGFIEVEANSEKEAQQKLDDGEEDEIDNKSEYEFKGWVKDE